MSKHTLPIELLVHLTGSTRGERCTGCQKFVNDWFVDDERRRWCIPCYTAARQRARHTADAYHTPDRTMEGRG